MRGGHSPLERRNAAPTGGMKLLNIAHFLRSRLLKLFEPAGTSRLTTRFQGHRSEPPEVCSVGQGMSLRVRAFRICAGCICAGCATAPRTQRRYTNKRAG